MATKPYRETRYAFRCSRAAKSRLEDAAVDMMAPLPEVIHTAVALLRKEARDGAGYLRIRAELLSKLAE